MSVVYIIHGVRNDELMTLQDVQEVVPVDFNDKLRLASSWFGLCGIAKEISPQPNSDGIEVLHADTFDLHSFHTLTGTTFMLVTTPNFPHGGNILSDRCVCFNCVVFTSLRLLLRMFRHKTIICDEYCSVYRLYCDYVLKNPFYEADQVIKSELFDRHVVTALRHVKSTS